jgi:hypothetical protein
MAWIRKTYAEMLETPAVSAVLQVGSGGMLVFSTGVPISSS